MALMMFTLHVAKINAMLWSIEHYITWMLLSSITFKCILNVYWIITLVKKVFNFEDRSFFHFPTPKKPLRTNFLPSFTFQKIHKKRFFKDQCGILFNVKLNFRRGHWSSLFYTRLWLNRVMRYTVHTALIQNEIVSLQKCPKSKGSKKEKVYRIHHLRHSAL